MNNQQREYEAKIILNDCHELGPVEERLERLGAEPQEEVVEEDTYYQHPCRDFAETDEALRLRRSRATELTYKGPKRHAGQGVKARLEINIPLPPGSADTVDELLRLLGFHPVAVVRKRRRYYRLGDVSVTLDEVEGLGCFVEIEYSGPPGRDPVKAIEEAAEKLGLSGRPRTTKSYLEMLLEKNAARTAN